MSKTTVKPIKPITATTPVIRFAKDDDTGYVRGTEYVCRHALTRLFKLSETDRVRCKLVFSTKKTAEAVRVFLQGQPVSGGYEAYWGRRAYDATGSTYEPLAKFLIRSGFPLNMEKSLPLYVYLVMARG